jgi:hypothetical protein
MHAEKERTAAVSNDAARIREGLSDGVVIHRREAHTGTIYCFFVEDMSH